MDENFKNPFEDNIDKDISNEIESIQQEIDKDLNAAIDIIMPEEEEEISVSPGIREVAAPEIQPTPPEISVSVDSPDFFKETIKKDAKKGKFKRLIAVLCIVSILGGSTAGAMFAVTSQLIIPAVKGQTEPTPEFRFEPAEVPKPQNVGAYPDFSLGMSFADLIDAVEPSVVCISAEKSGGTSYGFFNVPNQSSRASGIIFDQDSEYVYIVSNNHVTDSANKVYVSVQGCEPVEASLVGKESRSDLVVVSVAKKDLKAAGIDNVTVAKFGSSKDMRVGDFAIAIGNAMGEGNTATFGFISATDKQVSIEDKTLTVLQTDAAINPGNSGGPLINLNGEVIGINTLKLMEAEVEGMGYCITSDVAMPIIEQLRNRTEKPMIGISGYTITEQIAQAYKLPPMGVVVESVVEGGSAAKAGIQKTDIITSFKGEPVMTMEQLAESVLECSVGDKVEIILIRNGKDTITLTLTLSARAEDNF